MDQIRYSIIEDIGRSYSNFGHSQLLGRVIGLLLCEEEPVTIDQMSEILHVTKTPINQICNRLSELELIKRVWVKGERKHHFEIVHDVFLKASGNQIKLYEENLRMIENDLDLLIGKYKKANKKEKEKLKLVCQRFINMREFHIQLIQTYTDFINEWKQTREHLPNIEDYLHELKINN